VTMNEGWYNGDYLIVFDQNESTQLTAAYGLPEGLPGYKLLALRSWDDLVVLSPLGVASTCPSVPAVDKYLKPFDMSALSAELKPDERYAGRVKWHITPLVFGGDPQLDDNTIWVPVEKHAELVTWWNQMYRESSPPE
jgi:hypothetical protein